MVANVLQIAPQGKGKKVKKTSLIQEKTQTDLAKVKKDVRFSALLNEKIDKKQKTSKEANLSESKDLKAQILQVKNTKPQHSKLEIQNEEKDARLEATQKASKSKKPKFQETQATAQELTLLANTQSLEAKEIAQHENRAKKNKSSKKLATPISPKTISTSNTHQSTQEQLALKKVKKDSKTKDLTPLKEALQSPLQEKKSEQKTLGDVAKLAKDLNLTKLQLEEEKPQNLPKITPINKEETLTLANKAGKANKNSPLQTLLTKNQSKSQKIQEVPKNEVKQVLRDEGNNMPQIQELPKEPKLREIGLSEVLKTAPKEKLELAEDKITQEEKKSEKTQELALNELKRETQFKISSSKEMLTQFSQRIREEILNYKPPFTKLSMELNPAELGKLEITITKKGKELQINVNANNANALQAFMQNQNEFRATLSNAGFSNVELNFSQGEGKGGGGNQSQEQQKRNKNSLEENITEIPALASMEIKMVQYA